MVWIEARFEGARAINAAPHLCLRAADIGALVEPLELTAEARELLVRQLYWLAGAFLSREFGRLFSTGPAKMRHSLETISAADKELNVSLKLMTLEALALY